MFDSGSYYYYFSVDFVSCYTSDLIASLTGAPTTTDVGLIDASITTKIVALTGAHNTTDLIIVLMDASTTTTLGNKTPHFEKQNGGRYYY